MRGVLKKKRRGRGKGESDELITKRSDKEELCLNMARAL